MGQIEEGMNKQPTSRSALCKCVHSWRKLQLESAVGSTLPSEDNGRHGVSQDSLPPSHQYLRTIEHKSENIVHTSSSLTTPYFLFYYSHQRRREGNPNFYHMTRRESSGERLNEQLSAGQDTADTGAGGLEDRLRGLILSNAKAAPPPSTSPPGAVDLRLPPHMATASLEEQQEYLANLNGRPPVPIQALSQAAPQDAPHSPQKPVTQNGHGGRKKLNQAQRRKLNSELSIPIGARPNTQFSSLARGGFQGPSPSPRGHHGHNGHSHMHQNQRNQHHPYSPHSQGQSPASPYSPQMHFQQGTPHPSMPQYHPNQPGHMHGPRGMQSPNQFQQQWTSNNGPEPGSYDSRPPPQNRQLYQPHGHSQGRGRPFGQNISVLGPEDIQVQSAYLEELYMAHIFNIGIQDDEIAEKESFRALVEKACRECIAEYEKQEAGNQNFDSLTVQLKCFGSMSSGFATKASDMDLALLSPHSQPSPESPESPIPRQLEKKLLSMGYGARLLTRTRVPIIKLCEKPTEKLMSDLMEERSKWENGFAEEDDDTKVTDGAEEENELLKPPKASKLSKPLSPSGQKSQAKPHTNNIKESTVRPTIDPITDDQNSPTIDVAESCKESESVKIALSKLKQKEHQSLGDYYNLAKRLLRKIGGRDVSTGSPSLSEDEYKLLNDVCREFVSGLSSEPLIQRLCGYKTLSPLFDKTLPFVQRSLQGVWTQIEGERLAMAWDLRPLTEGSDRHESEALGLVEAWRELQDKEGPLTEPLVYNRLLYVASEKLKRIASLRLVFFDQIHYEEPQYYEARALKLAEELGKERQAIVNPIIITHYINGIVNPQIRKEMQNSARSRVTLKNVALQHSILQLASDYEHALTTNLFNESDQADVEKFITLLRHPDIVAPENISGTPCEWEPSRARLMAKIRTLPDPTAISLNKPRDRYKDHLEFPKTGIGIQCDINFSAHLAIHNTLLLRCYSHSDPRVKALVLFVKHWAKVRGINTPYRGSLSSYGYVLMVLHYLVNVARPFVCPNLQALRREPPAYLPPAEIQAQTTCNGRDIHFWRNETEIRSLAERKMLNHNHDSVGMLLRGFFEYFAQSGQMTTVQDRGFDWGREVLSLRTQGGILTKQEKGWVGARTVVETTTTAAPPTPSTNPQFSDQNEQASTPEPSPTDTKPKVILKTVEEVKEIRHRYLFAIEDPFELDHNVARTVTHNGIVQIRDEFRRAWRIIRNGGKGSREEGLLDSLDTTLAETKGRWAQLLDLIEKSGPVSDKWKVAKLAEAVGIS